MVKNQEQYERMVKVLGTANSVRELETSMLLFVFDLEYERSDILLAEREVRQQKGWR